MSGRRGSRAPARGVFVFTAEEAAVIAAVVHVCPADEKGPGALEADVPAASC